LRNRFESVPGGPRLRGGGCFRFVLAPLSVVVLVVLVGCGARGVPSPEAAAEEFGRNLEAKSAEKIRDGLSEEASTSLSVEDVRELLKSEPAALSKMAAELRTGAFSIEVYADVPIGRGLVVRLRRERDEFRVVEYRLGSGRAETPEQALVSLREALLTRDMNVLLALLSPEKRREWEHTLARMGEALSALPLSEVDESGDVVRYTFPDGLIVELVRRDGVYVISEIE
jgi:hypothetical protein